jgi:hypothetical protein
MATTLSGGQGTDALAGAGGTLVTYKLRGGRTKPVSPQLTEAVARVIEQTYGPGYTAVLRSGAGHSTSGTQRHTPGRANQPGVAADFQIIAPDGHQLAGAELDPLLKNWVGIEGSMGVNRYPGERGRNFTHMDLIGGIQPYSVPLGKGEDVFWTYDGLDPKSTFSKETQKKLVASGAIKPQPANATPPDAQSAIASLMAPTGGPSVPDMPTAAMGYAPNLPDGAPPAPPMPQIASAAPPMPAPPPSWASNAGFPIDEALTGRSGQDVLAGGPRMDPRRAGPATGPMPPDMGAMRSPADVLAAGPNLRPSIDVPMPTPPPRPTGPGIFQRNAMSGAPDAGSVPTPPSRASGLPSPPMNPRRDPFGFPIDVNRPRINNGDGTFSTEETTTFDASEVGLPPEIVTIPTIVNGQRVSEDEAKAAFAAGQNPAVQRGFRSFDEADRAAMARTDSIRAARATNGERDFPQFYGQQPGPPMPAGLESMVAGREEFPGGLPAAPRSGDLSATMGGPPQPPPAPTADTRVPARTDLTPELMSRLRERQGIGPFLARPEFPGELPAAPNPYDDPSRRFDDLPPQIMAQERREREQRLAQPPAPPPPQYEVGNLNYSDPPPPPPSRTGDLSAAMGGPPAPYVPDLDFAGTPSASGPQSGAMTGEGAPSAPNWQSPPGVSGMTGPPMPAPPATSQMSRDQFNISFSPGGPGMIADLPMPAAPTPPSNPFDALMGPTAAMGAIPFNDASHGVGAPDFGNARAASSWDSAPSSNLGLDAAPPSSPIGPGYQGASAMYGPLGGGSVINTDLPTPVPGQPGVVSGEMPMPGALDIQSAAQKTLSTEAPPPLTQQSQPRQTSVNPATAKRAQQFLGGLLLGPVGAVGGLLGNFGQSAAFSPFAGSGGTAPSTGANGQVFNTTYRHGSVTGNPNMQGTMWNRSNGGSVGYVTDPVTGTSHPIFSGSPTTF